MHIFIGLCWYSSLYLWIRGSVSAKFIGLSLFQINRGRDPWFASCWVQVGVYEPALIPRIQTYPMFVNNSECVQVTADPCLEPDVRNTFVTSMIIAPGISVAASHLR